MTSQPITPTTPASARLRYRPELDGLRAVAVMGVILAHISDEQFGNGYVGVELFFVLSGYLITALLLSEHERKGVINFRHFYARRALRLLPALYACILVWSVLGVLARPEARAEHYLGVLSGATYISNWVRALSPHTLGPTGYLWSLAVEEQFYVFWPPLVALLLRKKVKNPLWIVAFLVMLTAGWRVALSLNGATSARLDNGLDTRMDGLLLGACLAYVLAKRRPRHSSSPFRWTVWISGAVIGWLIASWVFKTLSPVWIHNFHGFSSTTVLCLIAIGPIVAFGRSVDGAVNSPVVSALSWPPLVRIGRLSYGLYLWHSVAIFLFASRRLGLTGVARIAPTLITLVVLALLSERFVEQPFMRKKTRFHTE